MLHKAKQLVYNKSMFMNSFFASGLPVGQEAPNFSLLSGEMKSYTLEDFRGKNVLLYFYPQAFTSGCTAQACSLREGYEKMKDLGFELLGISVDPPERLHEFSEKYQLPFPLLSDSSRQTCINYQVLLPILKKATRITYSISRSGIIVDKFRFLPWNNYSGRLLKKL